MKCSYFRLGIGRFFCSIISCRRFISAAFWRCISYRNCLTSSEITVISKRNIKGVRLFNSFIFSDWVRPWDLSVQKEIYTTENSLRSLPACWFWAKNLAIVAVTLKFRLADFSSIYTAVERQRWQNADGGRALSSRLQWLSLSLYLITIHTELLIQHHNFCSRSSTVKVQQIITHTAISNLKTSQAITPM